MGKSPFQVVYVNAPIAPFELMPLLPLKNYNLVREQRSDKIQELYAQVKEMIAK